VVPCTKTLSAVGFSPDDVNVIESKPDWSEGSPVDVKTAPPVLAELLHPRPPRVAGFPHGHVCGASNRVGEQKVANVPAS
jgi:hypothetical protein